MKLIFGFIFSFFTVFAFANAQESALTGTGLFGSSRPDNERLVPNCTTRNEYNAFTKQYTQNEVCSPYVVFSSGSSNTNSSQQRQRMNQQIYTQPIVRTMNTTYYNNNNRNPASTYYYDYYYIQPQQRSNNQIGTNNRQLYMDEEIYYSQNSGLTNWDNTDNKSYRSEDMGNASTDNTGYQDEEVGYYDQSLSSGDTSRDDYSYGYGDEDVGGGLTSWDNSGYMNEDLYSYGSESSNYVNEGVGGYSVEEVYY